MPAMKGHSQVVARCKLDGTKTTKGRMHRATPVELHLCWLFSDMLSHCCPVSNAVHVDGFQEEELLVSPPGWVVQWECEEVHDTVAVTVFVIPKLNSNAETLDTKVEIHANCTLDANMVCDVALTVVTVVQGPAYQCLTKSKENMPQNMKSDRQTCCKIHAQFWPMILKYRERRTEARPGKFDVESQLRNTVLQPSEAHCHHIIDTLFTGSARCRTASLALALETLPRMLPSCVCSGIEG